LRRHRIRAVVDPYEATSPSYLTAARRRWSGTTAFELGPVVRPSSIRRTADATSSTAVSNAGALASDGLRYPLILRTNWRAASRISSSVAGGSAPRSCWMFLHMGGV